MTPGGKTSLGALPRYIATYKAILGCLAATWALTAATHHYVIVPASVLPQVAADLGVTPGVAVWLVSAVPGSWAVTNFVLGVYIDRLGDYRMITIATGIVFLTGVWSWWAGLTGSFSALLASRLVAGIAIGVIWTASTNLIGGIVTARNRGTAIGVYLTSAPSGFVLGQLSTPAITSTIGWPAGFLVMPVTAIAALGVLSVSVSHLAITPTLNTASMGANFRAVLKHRIVWYACAMAFAAYSYYLFLNSWLPTYLAQQFGLSAALSAGLAAVFPAMGVLSRIGGGFISDRLFDQRRIPVLRAAFVISLPVIVLIGATQWLLVVIGALVAAGFVIQLTFSVVYSYVREAVRADITGSALAFLTTAGIFGAFSAPILTGAMIDLTGSFFMAFVYVIGLTIIGLALAFAAPESPRAID